MRTAIVLLSYNRPLLVRDALESVCEQDDQDWHCYVADDGSDERTRAAIITTIHDAKRAHRFTILWGRDRSVAERQAHLAYSWNMNNALAEVVANPFHRYVCTIPDDDYLYPEAVGSRADYLDANPDAHVAYGRLRAVHYGPNPSDWNVTGPPTPGRAYPRPTGPVSYRSDGRASFVYFVGADGDVVQTDPQTGAPYVEQGLWLKAPHRVADGHPDHGQVMWRIDCLRGCREWKREDGRTIYWNETLGGNVGDASFYEKLSDVHDFHPVDAWCVSKRYHNLGDGWLQDYARTGGRRE